jgi:hypothetical protein
MSDLTAKLPTLGYCTNVHAGADLEETRANLENYALAVKRRVSPEAPMGIGLWLSAQTAWELVESESTREFADWLLERGLHAFTLNGFPFGDFHQEVVKHQVYHPNWADSDRLEYTLDLVTLLGRFLGEATEGSISTLPVGWREDLQEHSLVSQAAANLLEAVSFLEMFEQETGKLIHLDLEPEPGCYLDRSRDVVDFFKNFLLRKGKEEKVLRYLRVCHDICHSAVMAEDQAEAFENYRTLGIRIGKVQVSSAVRVDFDTLDSEAAARAFSALFQFQEHRYLHQTTFTPKGGEPVLHTDLPIALTAAQAMGKPSGEWRVHFHVPIFQENLESLGTTQGEILEGLALLRDFPETRHYEVETYAWGVLPEAHRAGDLAEGIAREMIWMRERFPEIS